MNKKFILPLLVTVLIAALFLIPVNEEKTVPVKAPFLNVYAALFNPTKWTNWHPLLRQAAPNDSASVHIQQPQASFTIKYDSLQIRSTETETVAQIDQQAGSKSIQYAFSVIPGKFDKQQG